MKRKGHATPGTLQLLVPQTIEACRVRLLAAQAESLRVLVTPVDEQMAWFTVEQLDTGRTIAAVSGRLQRTKINQTLVKGRASVPVVRRAGIYVSGTLPGVALFLLATAAGVAGVWLVAACVLVAAAGVVLLHRRVIQTDQHVLQARVARICQHGIASP